MTHTEPLNGCNLPDIAQSKPESRPRSGNQPQVGASHGTMNYQVLNPDF